MARWSSQKHRPPTVFFAKSLESLTEKDACAGCTELQAPGLVAGCRPLRGIAGLPVGLHGERAVEEVVVLWRKVRRESAQERSQLQRAMCVVIILDGQCDTEPAFPLRTPERRKSFRKSAGTREQVNDGHDPRHGVVPTGERTWNPASLSSDRSRNGDSARVSRFRSRVLSGQWPNPAKLSRPES